MISWESAFIIEKILNLLDIHKNNIIEVSNGLKDFEFDGPRGTVSFDSKTNTTLSPLFEAKIVEKNGFCEIEIEKTFLIIKKNLKN